MSNRLHYLSDLSNTDWDAREDYAGSGILQWLNYDAIHIHEYHGLWRLWWASKTSGESKLKKEKRPLKQVTATSRKLPRTRTAYNNINIKKINTAKKKQIKYRKTRRVSENVWSGVWQGVSVHITRVCYEWLHTGYGLTFTLRLDIIR